MYIVDGLLVCLFKNWFAIQDQSKKKKDYKPTHYVPAYHLAHTLVCNEDQFSEALVLFTLGMQICQLDIDSLTVNMISPVQYLMTLLSLSLIARMIEKYACFKC